jgi:large subunit ribosomal protein L29
MKTVQQVNDLRGLTVEDLRQRARDLDDQVFRLRIQRSMGQAESGNKVRPLRKERARVMTILREKGIKD